MWPFETLKNQVQAGLRGSVAEKEPRSNPNPHPHPHPHPHPNLNRNRNPHPNPNPNPNSVPEKVRALGGVGGLYRGILPGSLSVFLPG